MMAAEMRPTGKGAAMRRSYFFTLILTLAFLALPAVIACGSSSQPAASAEADLSTPLGILQAAAEASQIGRAHV